MPCKKSLDKLKETLTKDSYELNLFLQTDENIYSFRNDLTKDQREEFINPIINFIKDKNICKYDSLDRKAETIYYILKEMDEFKSLELILSLHNQIKSGDCETASIKTIENEKIKLAIFKKGDFLLLYRYNASSILKQGIAARFFPEKAVVEKQNNNLLILSKTIPDIIVDTENNDAFILNMTQAEYILNIMKLFKGTLNVVATNLKEFQLMDIEGIDRFIQLVSEKNGYIRKLHKIQTTESYKHLKTNKNVVPSVLEKYNLNVEFDEKEGEIIFNEDTDITDVLHLLADDYVKRYISKTDDIVE
ncbi:Kiwa anti-phage protein KwaB-like domain-containing protein [Clostridium botulinum]|uniref:Kiwa anti-phage protein KwaB-like domain-containing protein n=1 Tax=Clostridium botulinum TaxID=1491 RepID=UPI00094736F9|nr:Kiwa anti-phage protein KwaB-like domain-containing protein [Clostridium botulinum]APQ98096.1 hypothetical protein RSJ3_1323 [Clostridium botulinum]MBN3362089.1 hypothetical protein [Clostridium botulinum]